MDKGIGIEILVKAAQYLEWQERVGTEHGYSTSPPLDIGSLLREDDTVKRRPNKFRKPQGSRSTHNELEKNRRAHLRYCLEKLKEIVPLGPDSSRHTTLGLLTKAKAFIKALEDKQRKQGSERNKLEKQHKLLMNKLNKLTNGGFRVRVERSFSECSSNVSTSSTSSYEASYESDEVDIIGYGSEDDSSTHSSLSEGGCSVVTRNLTKL